MNITFTGHRIILEELEEKNIIISSIYKIICFAINEKYIAICEDWKRLDTGENVSIYDIKGNFLFKLISAPKSLYKTFGYYSVVSFKTENILVVQSNDFRYEYDIEKRDFINEVFTK